jgi:nucleoporin NDC1
MGCSTLWTIGLLKGNRPYERRRLNERPIYLRSVFFILAATQALMHLYYDYDIVVLPIPKLKAGGSVDKPTDVEPPTARLKRDAPVALRSSIARAVATSIVGPFVYALLIRPFAWPWSLYLARLFWSIPKDSAPPRFPPYHISLILRSATAGMLLLCLWDLSNEAFSAFVAQEPLKKGRPLTDDSRDPNGSLLNGLKSKKEAPRVRYILIASKTSNAHTDIRILGITVYQQPVRIQEKVHLLRIRSRWWSHLDPYCQCLSGCNPGCQ